MLPGASVLLERPQHGFTDVLRNKALQGQFGLSTNEVKSLTEGLLHPPVCP